MTLHPIVDVGQRVKKGDLMTDGYATDRGDLALGRNLLVAFMPWKGYNYEDAVVINQRLVREDFFTSVHVDEYILEVRDTKRGPEELTNDIPNVSEEATKDLDEHGMIRIGAKVVPGDILIGKITPKGESDPSPEEKLLRAIFGDKAGDVKDASLKASPSLSGVVIDKKLFSGAVKDPRRGRNTTKVEQAKVESDFKQEVAEIREILLERLGTLVINRVSQGVKDYYGTEKIAKGQKITLKLLQNLDFLEINPNGWISDREKSQLIARLINNYVRKYKERDAVFQRKIFNIAVGDELPAGILQLAKVEDINALAEKAGLPHSGRMQLFDGETGEPFDQSATVGVIYMLKLGHMVDDKMHARSIGPYSLITQQPLGGKAQFGGQRFGEMEVWALEAFGASHVLQEILTVKSDDVEGRAKTYEAIVKGEVMPEPGLPESLNVLLHELRGLGLNVELLPSKEEETALREEKRA